EVAREFGGLALGMLEDGLGHFDSLPEYFDAHRRLPSARKSRTPPPIQSGRQERCRRRDGPGPTPAPPPTRRQRTVYYPRGRASVAGGPPAPPPPSPPRGGTATTGGDPPGVAAIRAASSISAGAPGEAC